MRVPSGAPLVGASSISIFGASRCGRLGGGVVCCSNRPASGTGCSAMTDAAMAGSMTVKASRRNERGICRNVFVSGCEYITHLPKECIWANSQTSVPRFPESVAGWMLSGCRHATITSSQGASRNGYDTPSMMPQVLTKSKPTKLACCFIWASVSPVPPALVLWPEVAMSQ